MTLHATVFIDGQVLGAAPQLLYEVPGGRHARVHECAVWNASPDTPAGFRLYVAADTVAKRYLSVVSLAPGEYVFRPQGDWKQGSVIFGIATVAGIIGVRASGSLLEM